MEIFVKNICFYDRIGFLTKNGLIWILLLISTLILYSLLSSLLLKIFPFSSEAFSHRSCPYISFSFFFFLFILFSFPCFSSHHSISLSIFPSFYRSVWSVHLTGLALRRVCPSVPLRLTHVGTNIRRLSRCVPNSLSRCSSRPLLP